MKLAEFAKLQVGARILVRNIHSKTDEWATVNGLPFDGGTMVAAMFDNLQQQAKNSGMYPAKSYSVYFRDVVQLGCAAVPR